MPSCAHASCKYFKVVDSDDWLDRRSLQKILLRMMHWEKQGKQADMIVCNYVYDPSTLSCIPSFSVRKY